MSPIENITSASVSKSIEPGKQQEIVSLEDRLIKAYAETAVESEKNRKSVLENMEKNVKLTPEELIKVQDKVLNYNIELSFISTVARKTVSAVETLLRS